MCIIDQLFVNHPSPAHTAKNRIFFLYTNCDSGLVDGIQRLSFGN